MHSLMYAWHHLPDRIILVLLNFHWIYAFTTYAPTRDYQTINFMLTDLVVGSGFVTRILNIMSGNLTLTQTLAGYATNQAGYLAGVNASMLWKCSVTCFKDTCNNSTFYLQQFYISLAVEFYEELCCDYMYWSRNDQWRRNGVRFEKYIMCILVRSLGICQVSVKRSSKRRNAKTFIPCYRASGSWHNLSIVFYYSFIFLCMYTPWNQHFKAFLVSKINSVTSFCLNFSRRIQIS